MVRLVAAVVCAGLLVVPGGHAARPVRLAVEETFNGGPVMLWRTQPLSLARIGTRIRLGEYHSAWALSPDRSRVAFGISASGRGGRVGVRVVDVARWRVVANITIGAAAEALWWPSRRRLVTVPQRGGVVVADPATARIVSRVRLADVPTVDAVYTAAVTPDRLVVLLGGGATVAVVDAAGSVRTVALDRIHVVRADGNGYNNALVAGGDRAIVVGDGIAAEIDLRTLAVRYHDVAGLASRTQVTVAVALGRTVAVSGRRADRSAAGLDLLDTTGWRVRPVEERADSLTPARDVVIAYRRDGHGVRGYRPDGTRAFAILEDKVVRRVVASGTTAYVTTSTATFVVDTASGAVARRIVPPRALLNVIDVG
jgi:hypothetical protein